MATLTTFDQNDGWDDDIFRDYPDIDSPAHYPTARPAVTNEGILASLDPSPYVPYVSAGDAEFEPIEVLDEEPRWEYYFSGRGRPDQLEEDPYEEAAFMRTERILPGKHMGSISPRKSHWSIFR